MIKKIYIYKAYIWINCYITAEYEAVFRPLIN